MQLVRGIHNLRPRQRGCVATVGNFDGVHLGHQAILKRLCERAVALGLPSSVVIFEPQPSEFFAPDAAPVRLSRLRDKLELLATQGIDQVVCLAFNEHLSQLTATAFVQQVLVDGLQVRHLEVGDDFRFGCDRSGNFAFLQQAGALHGFSVEEAATFELDGSRVSSTRVRQALAAADFTLARRLLGRPFSIAGRVLHGQKLGRQLGAPTANIQLKRRRVPLHGVFLVSTKVDGVSQVGVANIGMRPSVSSDGQAHLEAHLLDCSADLYGRHLVLVFHSKLRDERRFTSLEELKSAITADIATARARWRDQPLNQSLD